MGIIIMTHRVNTLNQTIIEKNMKFNDWHDTDPALILTLNKTELKNRWQDLHQADLAQMPSGDLLDAWLAFHNGQFAEAAKMGRGLGVKGLSVLLRSVVAYTDYVCEDDNESTQLLQDAYQYGVEICEDSHFDYNCEFTTALTMGRYSQSISVTKALHQGMGGKIKSRLTAVLDHQPDHAEAHIAMALYHAEVINKVGATLGGITYGAKAKSALQHIEQALNLAPTAINLIEAGNAYILLKEKNAVDKATDLYRRAAGMEPLDALQAMDIDFAQSQLD
jgi:tetratricopeptide (TPR) repeat protein